jgi:aspartate--ammonia ligase
MNSVTIPQGYRPALTSYETQHAISMIKRIFADMLAGQLNLRRVSAPLFVEAATGLNDDLNGVERPVGFDIKATGTEAQVVQSLAKWKRQALYDYDFHVGNGLYTDMNAIRRDEDLDNLHSIYVDQWDWEKVITADQRNLDYLKDTVRGIVEAVISTERTIRSLFPALNSHPATEREIAFITTQELEDLYPDLSGKERENAFVREHHTTFLMQIGGKLKSGQRHDGRAPDYDDWSLNGDLLFWNYPLQQAYELSSMGIRVDAEAMDRQLTLAGCDERRKLPFHQGVLTGKLPLSIGGGIGQSRLCMLLMGSAHIGEVQATIWDEETRRKCKEAGIPLL